MKTFLTIIYALVCIALIVIVLLQKGKNAGMSGAIDGGSSETFYGKNKGKSKNAMLEKFTAAAAIIFIVLAIVLSLVIKPANNVADVAVTDTSAVTTLPADTDGTATDKTAEGAEAAEGEAAEGQEAEDTAEETTAE